ncbi:MAG TPA: hypothetical protein DCW42_03415 [Bacteroidetes bacterium]|nr:hypothetical protein [Bacteroidota bacterium]
MTKTTYSSQRKPSQIQTKSSSSSRKTTKKQAQWLLPWTKQNFIIMAIGLGVIIVGYLLMATGITEGPALPEGKWNNPLAVTVAPILLVLGYCVILPFGIFKSFVKKQE